MAGGRRIARVETGPLHSTELPDLHRRTASFQLRTLRPAWGPAIFDVCPGPTGLPEVRKAIRNGRRLHELINEAGVRYVAALKTERKRKAKGEKSRGLS